MYTDIQAIMKKNRPAATVGPTNNQSRQTFDLPALVADFCEWYGQCLADRDLPLTTRINPDIPLYVEGYRTLMHHLLFAPGKNSLLFAGTGNVSVEVDVEQHTSRRHSLSFTISLAGVSIPLTREKALFQSAAARSARGGFRRRSANLYYARMIAESFGGDIRVDNTAGFGLRYLVEISIFSPPS